MYNPRNFFSPFGPPPFRPPTHDDSPSPSNRPPGPPPSTIPENQPTLKAVDPGAIRYCRYKYTYLWLKNGHSFWTWLTYVGRHSVSGWRWIGWRWVYFGTDLRNITDFVCY